MSDIFDATFPLKSPASKEGKLQLAGTFIERCNEILNLLNRRYEADKQLKQQYDRLHIDLTEFFNNVKSFYVSEHSTFQNLPEDEEGIMNATVMFHPTNGMYGFDMIRSHIDWLLSSMKKLVDDPRTAGVFYLQASDIHTDILHLDRIYKDLLHRD